MGLKKQNEQNVLFDVLTLEGKQCQNDIYDWHKYPKTRKKDSPFPDSRKKRNTVLVVTRTKNPEVGVFCYHCFLGFLGKCINDWREAGYTEKEILGFIPELDNEHERKVV